MFYQFLKWSDDYSVGIEAIDIQHRHLIDLINRLRRGLSEPGQDRKKIFRETAKECVAYVKEHFSTEETLLQENKYPEHAAHKREHTSFVRRLLADTERFDKGDNLAPNRFASFLGDWLIDHIAIEDQKYAGFLREKGL